MRNSFKTLLESVKAQCPDIITEEVMSDMMDQFDAGIEQIEADAKEAGQQLGFKDGYDEGKRVAQAEAEAALAALTEKLDTEAVTKVTEILSMVDNNNTAKLQEFYDWVKTNMVPKAEYDQALIDQAASFEDKLSADLRAQDEDYANKFQTAIDAIDEAHANKLQIYSETVKEQLDKKYTKLLTESIETIDAANAAKLQQVVNLLKENKEKALNEMSAKLIAEHKAATEKTKVIFEEKIEKLQKELKSERNNKLNILAEGVEKYINYALEKFIPTKQLISEAKYNAASKTLDKIVDLLSIHKIIEESKDGVFQEYNAKLEDAKSAQNKLILEKIELTAELNKKEAQLLLENKIQKCTPAEGRFLRTYFKDAKNATIIEESLEDAHLAWKKYSAESRRKLEDSVKNATTKTPSTVVTESTDNSNSTKINKEQSSKKTVIAENKKDGALNPDQELVDFYAKCL